MSKLPWLCGALASLAVGAAILYRTNLRPLASLGVDEYEIPVQVAQAVKVSTPVVVRLKGELRAANEIDVNARVAGKVSEIHYKTGDWVRSGALVATLQSPELVERVSKVEATVESARAEVRQRQSQRSEAEKQLQKIKEWHDRDLIPRADLERALAALETADAQITLAESRLAEHAAMLAQSRQLLSLTRLIAPISGVITKVVEPGTAVKSSAAVLTIASTDKLKVQLRAGTKNPPAVSTGMSAEVYAENGSGKSGTGKILRVESYQNGAVADPEIEIELSSWNRIFQPGAPVIVSIHLPTENAAVSIPSSAIVETADKTYVFKLVGGRAVPTEVIVAERQNGKTAVNGLNEEDRVIIEPPAALKPDSRLRISLPAVSSLGYQGRISKGQDAANRTSECCSC